MYQIVSTTPNQQEPLQVRLDGATDLLNQLLHICETLSPKLDLRWCKAYIPLRRKTIRLRYWRWLGPPTPQFCVTYTNMLVSKNEKTLDANFALPKTKPKRKSVEYRLHWVPNVNFSRWPCTFHFFGVDFIHDGFHFFASATQTQPDAKAVLSGIWA